MANENLHFTPLYIENETSNAPQDDTEESVWIVMRSRKEKTVVEQPSATGGKAVAQRLYGYEIIQSMVRRFFMPMKESVTTRGGKRVRKISPAIPDIFFVNDTVSHIDEIVRKNIGVEYLYIKGHPYRQPVVIRNEEMDNFIAATTSSQRVTYHTAGDDNLARLIGRRVRIPHNDSWIEGELLTIRGSRYRRLRISLRDCLVAYIDLHLPPTTLIETLP
ncbi:MAG: hypothetical protein HDS54_03750 [Barnesiella sp.]|nr:hypothetical protein [Barnesiella sp.]